jgi:hypothetical protein
VTERALVALDPRVTEEANIKISFHTLRIMLHIIVTYIMYVPVKGVAELDKNNTTNTFIKQSNVIHRIDSSCIMP